MQLKNTALHRATELHPTDEQRQALVLPQQQGVHDVIVPIQVRSCRPGEVMGSQQNVCDPCPAGQYSFNASGVACHDACPDNAICPQGAILVPVEGYWHSAADATFIQSCPNQAACRSASAEQLLLLLMCLMCKMLLLLWAVCIKLSCIHSKSSYICQASCVFCVVLLVTTKLDWNVWSCIKFSA